MRQVHETGKFYAGLSLNDLRDIYRRKMERPPQTAAGWFFLNMLEREMVKRLTHAGQ